MCKLLLSVVCFYNKTTIHTKLLSTDTWASAGLAGKGLDENVNMYNGVIKKIELGESPVDNERSKGLGF